MSESKQRLDVVFINLEHLMRTYTRLTQLAQFEAHNDPKLIDVALESITGSPAREGVSKAIVRIREAIVRLFKWLSATIKDVVSNYRIRTERLHVRLNTISEEVREGRRAGWLSGQRVAHIDNLPIASALFKGRRVRYSDTLAGLREIEGLMDLGTTVIKNRNNANTTLARNVGQVKGLAKLRELLPEHKPSALVNKPAHKNTLSQFNLKAGQHVSVSASLCGNNVLSFTDYSPSATLAHFVDGAPAHAPVPWAGSSYGYRLVKENPTLNMRNQQNTVFSCLSASEITTMLTEIRVQLPNLKHATNTVDDAVKTIRRLERQVEHLAMDKLSALERRLVSDYYLHGSRQDYNLGIDLMAYCFSVIFNSLMWVRISLRHYK